MGFYFPVLFKRRHSQYKKACSPKHHPAVLCADQVNNEQWILYNFEKHSIPPKQPTDFILIHNSQEVEMQMKVSLPTMLWEQTTELLQIWDPFQLTHFIPHICSISFKGLLKYSSASLCLFPHLWNKGDHLSTY